MELKPMTENCAGCTYASRGKHFHKITPMSTPQITLADCLAEINNAINYWYPLPVRDSKLDEELGRYRPYGASREECDARHVRLFQFRDRLQQQLKAAGKDAAFDLAMAMAELARVAAERDKAIAERDASRAHFRSVSAERDSYKAGREDLAAVLATYAAERDEWQRRHQQSAARLDIARQSLRAAEQDVAEMESASSDLRTVNARLVADLAAATQRAETAEAILRAKA